MLNSMSSFQIPLFNPHIPIQDLNAILNVCYSAAWLAGVTCILHLTYKFIREYTYVTVNCWFCNQDSRVPFKQKNEWTCSLCEQFNGFTKDGDYSKLIPEQYDERLSARKVNITPRKRTPPHLNGLCRTCNVNQELKIRQIASYVPLKEKEYDFEIEAFKAKLERSYKLCSICEQTVQSTLKLKSRMYCAENLSTRGNSSSKRLSKEDRSGKWKHLISLLLVTVTLASLWNYLEFREYIRDYENNVQWAEILQQLSTTNIDENHNFSLNILVLMSVVLFTKAYFDRITLSSLLLFGFLSFATSSYISTALKFAFIISTFIYLGCKFMKKKVCVGSFQKLSKKCHPVNSTNENISEKNSFSCNILNDDVPLSSELSDLNLGRTRSASSTPKPSYLFKSNKLLVQPARLILDDAYESSNTIETILSTSSGYESVSSYLRKSPDTVSEFDSISQVGNERLSMNRRSSPNALIPYQGYRPTYISTSDQFYGVSSVSKNGQSNSVLSASEIQVSPFFSTLQIFLCSLAFFILGFSFQLLLSNLAS